MDQSLANFAKRHDDHCRQWLDRKAAKTNKIIATKALGCKLAKAAWNLMSEGSDYDAKRMWPLAKKGEFVRTVASQTNGLVKNPSD